MSGFAVFMVKIEFEFVSVFEKSIKPEFGILLVPNLCCFYNIQQLKKFSNDKKTI